VAVARPFLKFAGGKTQLLPDLRKFYPAAGSFGRYVEPFLGGGAVFFDLVDRGGLGPVSLADGNAELVTTYRALRDSVKSVILTLRGHAEMHRANPKLHYLGVRASRPTTAVGVAARLIYLNKTCFNGLYRLNSLGFFNSPPGNYKNPTICDEVNLRAVSRALANVDLDDMDFRAVEDITQAGDFVYLDPPYVPASKTANFTAYTAGGFGPRDQAALVSLMRRLDRLGCLILLSNADTPAARALYDGFHIHAVEAKRNINCNGNKRGKVGEIIVCNEALKRALDK
jgi:DNA adenine methylase